MKKMLALCVLLISTRAFADYDSAVNEINRSEQAAREAASRAAVPGENADLMARLGRIAAHHGGYSAGPTVLTTAEDGFIRDVAFGTRDGWECKIDGFALECANTRTREQFIADMWDSPKFINTQGWNSDSINIAKRFLGYVAAAPSKRR